MYPIDGASGEQIIAAMSDPEGACAFPFGGMSMPREIKLASEVRPPRAVHKFVLELINRIGAEPQAVWVPVTPAKEALPGYCFYNVASHVKKHSGKIQYGWAIWQCANLFIEGEFHAVWVSPKSEIVDITPSKWSRTLFVPDNGRVWEERRVENIRLGILDRPEIHEYFKVASEHVEFLRVHSVPSDPQRIDASPEEHSAFVRRKARLQMEMAKYIPPVSAICPCESGRHFGNCCGKF